MRLRFEIEGMDALIREVKRGCQTCQASEDANWALHNSWKPNPIPPQAMTHISMDVVHMPSSKTWDGKEVDGIFVIVDRLTGWIVGLPIANRGFTASKAAKMTHHYWFDIFGTPVQIMTDLGPQFAGAWFRTFCSLRGVH